MIEVSDLDEQTRAGVLVETLPDGRLRCLACAHRCVLSAGGRGVCQVRFEREGQLLAPWGYVAALQADPVEKKPLWHFLPGAVALTFGMLGCNLRCAYCQNWFTSQALRDPACAPASRLVRSITPQQITALALESGAKMVVSSYNEPFITAEWAAAVFESAQQAGLRCAMVSNGHATPQALRWLRPWLNALKVDLKAMRQEGYRALGGSLKHTLACIEAALSLGLWVEVVTLVVPGLNDSSEELWQMAHFLRGLSADIPWHVTAFHPDYHLTDRDATSAEALLRAADLGREAGLNFVYAGNLPGQVGDYEQTRCPHCQALLVERRHFRVLQNHLRGGACPGCGEQIAGVWA